MTPSMCVFPEPREKWQEQSPWHPTLGLTALGQGSSLSKHHLLPELL